MAATLLPALTGPHPIGNRRLFLSDASRRDPYTNAASRLVPVIAWYPTITAGPVAQYLSNNTTYDESMALTLTNVVEGRGCSKSWFTGAISCGAAPVADTMYPNIRSRDTHAVLNGAIDTSLGLLPTVVISPGFGLPGNLYSILAQDLASNGYLVLMLNHLNESVATETATGVVGQYFTAAVDQRAIATRGNDVIFILNQLATLPNGIGAAADVNAIAAVGHSYGGYTALETAYHDARIKAVVSLDGTAGWPGTENHAQDNGVAIPVMLLSGALNPSDNYLVAGEHPSWATFKTKPHGPLYTFQVLGTRHHAFSDVGLLASPAKRPDLCGSIGAARAMQIHTWWTKAFLDAYVRGTGALPTLPDSAWPEVVAF